MAAIMACQATRNSSSASHFGRVPWISASWGSFVPFPVASATIASAQARAMATTTGARPRQADRVGAAAAVVATSLAISGLRGERDLVVGLDCVAALERPHHPVLREVHGV